MRGPDVMQDTLFAVRSLESYVPADHPLRPVRDILNEALRRMDSLFAVMYAPAGRDSIAPEKLHFSVDGTLVRACVRSAPNRPETTSRAGRNGRR